MRPRRGPPARRYAGPVYPNVRCGAGHPDEPGYVVCVHVKDEKIQVGRVIPATSSSLGQILCADGKHTDTNEAALICATCARQHGWIAPKLNTRGETP